MTETYLSERQLARAEALDRARAVLVARGPLLSASKVEFPYELVGVARYITDGVDLFNAASEEAVAE